MTPDEKTQLQERLEQAEKFERLARDAERALEILRYGMNESPRVHLAANGNVSVVSGQHYVDIAGASPALMAVLEHFFFGQMTDAKRFLEAV